ncbi:MAG: hypothetical protein GY800_06435 [Planctomycetes bacterium]|nr:hypothetical protein [Planctomycetota bacterium]
MGTCICSPRRIELGTIFKVKKISQNGWQQDVTKSPQNFVFALQPACLLRPIAPHGSAIAMPRVSFNVPLSIREGLFQRTKLQTICLFVYVFQVVVGCGGEATLRTRAVDRKANEKKQKGKSRGGAVNGGL